MVVELGELAAGFLELSFELFGEWLDLFGEHKATESSDGGPQPVDPFRDIRVEERERAGSGF